MIKKITSLSFLQKPLRALTITGALSLFPSLADAQFTNGNIVVLQVGDGTQTLGNTGNSLFLKEYTPSGASGITIAIPDAGANALIITGTSTAEGLISLAADDSSIIIPGYNTAQPYSSSVSSSTSSVVPRGIGEVDGFGNFMLSATSSTAFSGGSIRSAAGDGNGNYWAGGANTGIVYFGNSTTPATVYSSTTNNRTVSFFQGNLLYSTGSGSSRGVYGGIGAPTSASVSSLLIPVLSTNSPYCYAINPTGDTAYVADDATFTGTGNQAGGIQKYYFNGASWVYMYTLQCGNGSTKGARGLVADFSGPYTVLYATTADASLNRLIQITDSSATAGASELLIATAAANTIFRGICFAPKAPACVSPSFDGPLYDSVVCVGSDITLMDAVVTGSGPFTYSWAGPNAYSSTMQNPTLTNLDVTETGSYTLTVTNACGSVDQSMNLTVNPIVTPSVMIEEMPVLGTNVATGGTATASTSYSVNPASDAFDGDTVTTGWGSTSSGYPQWLEYDFGSGNGKVINSYAFYCSSATVGGWNGDYYEPTQWAFEGFDGSTWNVLDVRSLPSAHDNTWYSFAFNNSTSYESYRINISNGIDGSYVFITELRMSDSYSYPTCANKNFLAESSLQGISVSYDWMVNGTSSGSMNEVFALSTFNVGDSIATTINLSGACATSNMATSSMLHIMTGPNNIMNTVTICSGDSVMVGGNTYNSTGTYVDNFTNMFGCDSIITTDLTVLAPITGSQTLSICAGQSVMVGTHTYNVTGTYTDTLVAMSGCDSIVTTDLTVQAVIDVTTSVSAETITANATSATYQWLDCNNGNAAMSGETNQSYTATMNGDYAVVVTVGSCSDTSSCVNINSIGLESKGLIGGISIYPNPAQNFVSIKSGIEISSIEVIDLTGKLIVNVNVNNTFVNLNISDISNGVYMLKVTSKNAASQINRLIINR